MTEFVSVLLEDSVCPQGKSAVPVGLDCDHLRRLLRAEVQSRHLRFLVMPSVLLRLIRRLNCLSKD